MTNQALPPPFISEPPIYDDLLGNNKQISPTWVDWFNSITRVMGYCITHDFIVDPTALTRRDAVVLSATSYTTIERDQFENARNGAIIYNTTNKQFEFRVEITPVTVPPTSKWVTFTQVPA